MKPYPTFEAWKRAVDLALVQRVGLTSDDLPDCNYTEWYAQRIKPVVAASKAIRIAKEY